MQFREAHPSPDLAHLIRSHWEFTVDDGAGGPILHEILPDGCVSISYGRSTGRLSVVGPRLTLLRVPVWGGSVFWGVKIAPAASGAVLGCEPAILRNQVANLTEIAPELAEVLLGQLSGAADFENAIAIFERALRGPETRIDDAAASAAAAIIEAGGSSPISEVAAATGLSQRQLERRFRTAVGLTPKQFARVRRLRAAAQLLVTGRAATWAERAAETGFADQSHMTREFGATTGGSPGRFERHVRAIDHGKLVD